MCSSLALPASSWAWLPIPRPPLRSCLMWWIARCGRRATPALFRSRGPRRIRPRTASCLRPAPGRRTLLRRPPRRRLPPCCLPSRLRPSRRPVLRGRRPSRSRLVGRSSLVRMASIVPPTVPSMAIASFTIPRMCIVLFRIGCATRAFRSLQDGPAPSSWHRLSLRVVLPAAAVVVVASLVPLRRRRLPPLRPRSLCSRLCRSLLLLLRCRHLSRCPPRPLLLLPRIAWRLCSSSSAPWVRRASRRSVCRVSRRLLRWRTFLLRLRPWLSLRPRRLMRPDLRMLRSGAALGVCCASIRARSTPTLRTPPARRPGASPARNASPLLARCRLPIGRSLRLSTSGM